MTTKHKPQKKRNKKFIDFDTLSDVQLKELEGQWEREARIFDARLQSYMRNPNPNEEKVERLWGTGASLWRRVRILERWLIRNNKK